MFSKKSYDEYYVSYILVHLIISLQCHFKANKISWKANIYTYNNN